MKMQPQYIYNRLYTCLLNLMVKLDDEFETEFDGPLY